MRPLPNREKWTEAPVVESPYSNARKCKESHILQVCAPVLRENFENVVGGACILW